MEMKSNNAERERERDRERLGLNERRDVTARRVKLDAEAIDHGRWG